MPITGSDSSRGAYTLTGVEASSLTPRHQAELRSPDREQLPPSAVPPRETARLAEGRPALTGRVRQARRHDLDWIRVIAICSLIPYHAALPFTGSDWVVSDGRTDGAIRVVCEFVTQWRMPLLFFISGCSTWAALQARTARVVAAARVRRLAIPIVAGLLLLVMPQLYFAGGLASPAARHVGFLTFLADAPHAIAGGPSVQWLHLWFIAYLFLVDVMLWPFLLVSRSARVRRQVARIPAPAMRAGGLLLLCAPFVVVSSIPEHLLGNVTLGGLVNLKTFLKYAVLYALGYQCAPAGAFWKRAIVDRWLSIGCAIAAYCVVIVLTHGYEHAGVGGPHRMPLLVGLTAARAVNTWCWILAVVGFAGRHLRTETPLLRYGREAAYPIYLVHQTVIVVIAAQVLRLREPIWPAYGTIVLLSFVLVLLAYEGLIRRTRITRVLFGLGPATADSPSMLGIVRASAGRIASMLHPAAA